MVESSISFLVETIQEMINNNESFKYINSNLDFSYWLIDDLKKCLEEKLQMKVYSHSIDRLIFHKEQKTIIVYRFVNKISSISIYNRSI